jgi:hypothetical protein
LEGCSPDHEFGIIHQSKVLEELNSHHELVIVSSSLDSATERIVVYLADVYGVSINALFFHVFSDEERQYLVRTWLHDPADELPETGPAQGRLEWNNEVYATFGESESRNWENARKYGFISAGGGNWYVGSLRSLQPGSRVWVTIPGKGYVGVGEVVESAVPVTEFMVKSVNGDQLLSEVETNAPNMFSESLAEQVVSVNWLSSLPNRFARWERGFFANQNTVARPRVASWQFTVNRLKEQFKID